MNDDIMILKEVAAYLKLAEKTSYRLAAEGNCPISKPKVVGDLSTKI